MRARTRTSNRHIAIALVPASIVGACAWCVSSALATPPPPSPAPPGAASGPGDAPSHGAAPAQGAGSAQDAPTGQGGASNGRTLDELLGLSRSDAAKGSQAPGGDAPSGATARGAPGAPGAPGAGDAPASREGDRGRLDRALREEELEDAFAQAVELMRQSADRLGPRADAGIETQRVQEDAVRRLDSIIDAARKRRQQQQQQSQRSSSRDRQNQDQNQATPQDGTPEMRAAARRDRAGSQERQPRGSQPGNAEPPGLEDGELDEVMHEGRVEWGSLPERVRELVQQGRRDRVSTLYLRLTEEYYRRMAEEASR